MQMAAWGLALLALNPAGWQADDAEQAAAKSVKETPATGFLFKTVKIGEQTYAYSVYLPPEYSEERAWPVILFLHGSGERGSDGLLQTEIGIGRAIRRDRMRCPAIVVMPQCRKEQRWRGEMLEMALRCVEETSREYRCDPRRVYLTGLSMGGAGAWTLASRMPDAFAAVVPICGYYGPFESSASEQELAQAGKNWSKLPIWCYHGVKDEAVPVERTREIVASIKAAGGEVKYDEIAEGTHNVWDRAYNNAALWKWLFSRRRTVEKE